MNKKASILYQIIIQLILISLIFALFFVSTTYKSNSKAIKQQIIEKQTALLIDSAEQGTSLTLYKVNVNGIISRLELKEGKVFAYVDDNAFSKGYDYFTKYNVELEEKEDKYIIIIK